MSETTTEETAPAAYVGEGQTDEQIIALRTTDTTAESTDVYTKVFVVNGVKPTEANGIDHAANKAAVREFAIQNGLRPTGEVELKSIKHNIDGVSWDITFTVPVSLTETVDGPSEADIVTQGEDAPANKSTETTEPTA